MPVKDTQQSTNIHISTPKNDYAIEPKGLSFSESSIEANTGAHKPMNTIDFLDAKSSAIASEVNEKATAGTHGNSPALGFTDLDDFFDVNVNSNSSRGVFKATEENHTKAGIEKDEQEEHDKDESADLSFSLADGEKEDEGERSEKSASSVASKDSLASVSNRSHSSASNRSDVKRGTTKQKEDLLSNVEDASLASEKSTKSISSVESKNSKRSFSEKSHSVVSNKSDNKIKTRASNETTDLPGEKNTEGESVTSDKSNRSISSKASNDSRPSLSDKSHSAISTKSKSDDNIKQNVLEQTVDKAEEESEKSASSARSSRRSLSKSSDNSKKSQGSKKTAPSSSSNIRSYAEDFSTGSKQASKKSTSEHAPLEDEHTVCLSDAEEVKTEDDISSSLSEDSELSKFQLDLTTKQAAPSEISQVSSEKAKDPSKNSSKSAEDLNDDVLKNASILAEDAKDVSKTSLSSDDNLMKEHLPEFPSETDLQNESADQTSRLDAEERSLSGAGDSELERVISSAAAAVELFEERSPNASSSVVPNDVASSVGARETSVDIIADKTATGLVSEAISEVLAIKAMKEMSSSAENGNNSPGGTGPIETEQKLVSHLFISLGKIAYGTCRLAACLYSPTLSFSSNCVWLKPGKPHS